MNRADATEATGIVERLLVNLNKIVPAKGRPGSNARTGIGDLYASVFINLLADTLGAPLDNCFELVRLAGATQKQFEQVRVLTSIESPNTLGATLVRDISIDFCLAAEGRQIADMTFVSRSDVDALMTTIKGPFDNAEEIAADSMDSEIFQALIALQATITNHLVRTALPLPRMLGYVFAEPLPSLVLAHRLYADPSRADEVVAENKIVHPAFCPTAGRALSA